MPSSDSVDSRLGRIEGKIDLLISRETITDERLHSVEKKVWYAAGASAVLAAVAVKLGVPYFPH
jgi:hypothetical protein